ncbi:MAG: HAD family phosphatase [bacterium]
MVRYSRLLVDLDGCTSDTWKHTLEVFQIIEEELGMLLDLKQLKLLLGRGDSWIHCCMDLFPGHSAEEFLFMASNNAELINSVQLTMAIPEIPEIFREFRQKHKIQIAIVTNRQTQHGLEVILSKSGLVIGDTIDLIVSLEEGIRPKPNPDLFYRAMQKLGVRRQSKIDRRSCLVVEDACNGLDAISSELDTCAVLWGYGTREQLQQSKPTYFAETVQGLKRIILGEVR